MRREFERAVELALDAVFRVKSVTEKGLAL
jgi:hypothetical protein